MKCLLMICAILAVLQIASCQETKKATPTAGKNATIHQKTNATNVNSQKSNGNGTKSTNVSGFRPPPQTAGKIGPHADDTTQIDDDVDVQKYIDIMQQCAMNNSEIAPYASKILEMTANFAKNFGLD